MRGRAQRSPPQDAEGEGQGHQRGVLVAVQGLRGLKERGCYLARHSCPRAPRRRPCAAGAGEVHTVSAASAVSGSGPLLPA